MEKIEWNIVEFSELTGAEVLDIFQLRQSVFIIEQNCIYDDIDGNDEKASHLTGYRENELLAYARIFPPIVKYSEASIGRIVTHPSIRGKGLGKTLVKLANEYCDKNFPGKGIRIEAQSHLQSFYEDLGYKKVSEVYPVDGIDHIEMIRA